GAVDDRRPRGVAGDRRHLELARHRVRCARDAVRASFEIREGSIEDAIEVCRRVPELESVDRAEFVRRLDPPRALILVAGPAGVRAPVVAFKAGYDRYRDGSFYSWLGGVAPEARRGGLAAALIDHQETWARQQGYARIHVKTRNRFVGMHVLLAKKGYRIVSVDAPSPDTPLDDLRLSLVNLL